MAPSLREHTEFVLVDNGEGGIGAADQDYVWRNRYVLTPAVTPERFSQDDLRQALENDLNLLASGRSPLLTDTSARAPTAATMTIVRALPADGDPPVRRRAPIA